MKFYSVFSHITSLSLSSTRRLNSLSTINGSAKALSTTERLFELRKLLQFSEVDAFIIPSEDPHFSEYPAACFQRREYISGFTGSAGVALATSSSALLFTDGRYFDQAEQELNSSDWTLMRQGQGSTPTMNQYLASLPSGSVIGIDPNIHSAAEIINLKRNLKRSNITIKALPSNPVDDVWASSRPAAPQSPVWIHPLRCAGRSVQEKLAALRGDLSSKGSGLFVTAALDEIAWLFNIRGGDVECNPVVMAYAMITADSAVLYFDSLHVTPEVMAHLQAADVSIRPYNAVLSDLQAAYNALQSSPSSSHRGVWMDGDKVSYAMFSSLQPDRIKDVPDGVAEVAHSIEAITLSKSPLALAKACKNPCELQGIRNAHVRDGVAVSEVLQSLEADVSPTAAVVSEMGVDARLLQARERQEDFVCPSFPTIAGFGPHGAIIHYRATDHSSSVITNQSLLLIDSGGHYIDGTTDITRTIHLGVPSAEEREMFTRVLKGHVALASKRFPRGTPGCLLDSFARQFLWEVDKDYGHGTGHGVGLCLNVHEGPQRISKVLDSTALTAGMVVSIEPGYYRSGHFGIRIENLYEVVEQPVVERVVGASAGSGTSSVPMLAFKSLTVVPFQRRLIDTTLLSKEEVDWIDSYHRTVRKALLTRDCSEATKHWLLENTKPLIETAAEC